MERKPNTFFPITLFIFIVIELYLVKINQNQLGIFLYLAYSTALYLIDKNYVISFFVYYLPLLPIILTDYKLAGFIGAHEIIYGFSYFVLLGMVKRNKAQLNKYQKLSITFVYFLFFFEYYPILKSILLGLNSDPTRGFMYLFKNFVRFFLYYQSLVMLIKVIYVKGLHTYILAGIKYAVVTIPISMIYTRELIIMGAGVSYALERKAVILSGQYERFVGFYGAGGDENSVGIFMVSAFAFFLALYEKDKNIKNHIVFMGFAIFGALLTGSRTTFMALTLVILIFMITNKSGKSKFAVLFAFVAFYFAFSKQLDMVIQRFLDPSANDAIDPQKKGRVFKWIFYTNWLFDNMKTFIIGNLVNIPIRRAPHNYFILIAYKAGIIPLFLFIRYLFKLGSLTTFKIKKFNLKNAYYIIPFPFIIMTVNSFGSSIYLWLFLPLGAYYLGHEATNNSVKTIAT